MEFKQCRLCHIFKPLHRFQLRTDKHSYRTECKNCFLTHYLFPYRELTKNDRQKSWYWCRRNQVINNQVRARYHITGKIKTKDFRNKFQNANNCWLCGKPTTTLDGWIDHTIPLTRGGTHSIDNIELFCRDCNELKNDFMLDELFEHMITILRLHNKLP